MWFRHHWVALLGALTLVPPFLRGINGLLGLGGNADFIISHNQEPGWVGTMLDWFLNPPPWALGPTMALGLALIYWDGRRRQAQPGLMPVGSPAPTPSNGFQQLEPVSIANLSKEDLVRRLETFTKRLRAFEQIENGMTDVEEAKLDVMSKEISIATAVISSLGREPRTDAEAKKSAASDLAGLQTRVSDLEKARAHRRVSEFQAQFLQEANQLRAELSHRTGRPVGGFDDPVTDLLDKGKFELDALKVLTGYLHEMADRLPG